MKKVIVIAALLLGVMASVILVAAQLDSLIPVVDIKPGEFVESHEPATCDGGTCKLMINFTSTKQSVCVKNDSSQPYLYEDADGLVINSEKADEIFVKNKQYPSAYYVLVGGKNGFFRQLTDGSFCVPPNTPITLEALIYSKEGGDSVSVSVDMPVAGISIISSWQ